MIRKIIVAGSRGFNDYWLMKETLKDLPKDCEIVSGMARGADMLAVNYAVNNGYKLVKFPANWEYIGKRAGYVRNAKMAKYANELIAFWDGESKGTKNMIEVAKKHGLKVTVKLY